MNQSRLLLVAVILVAITAATAFRTSVPTTLRAGSLLPTGQMLEPRSGHSATLLPSGKVLIAGGMRRNQDFYRSVELYDPATGKFQAAGEMNERRVGHAAVLLRSGRVLIAGGWIGRECTDSAELYDPGTGKFSKLDAKMASRRGNPSATLLSDGDVLIAGGADREGRAGVATAELFHPATNRFETVGTMRVGRISHTATLLRDGRVLFTGGRGESVNAISEIFDPKTKKFDETGNLLTARYKHTAGVLPDGRVLIAGGSDERDWNGNLDSAEIYDPKTGKFAAAPSLNDSRFKMPREAVQLVSGALLIAGGSKEVEIFDPGSGRFLVANGQMSDKWHFMSETRLADGRVLLAGGYPNSDQTTKESWIYRP